MRDGAGRETNVFAQHHRSRPFIDDDFGSNIDRHIETFHGRQYCHDPTLKRRRDSRANLPRSSWQRPAGPEHPIDRFRRPARPS